MSDLLARVRADRDPLLKTLEKLVLLESPSSSKTLVDDLGRIVSENLAQCGVQATTERRSSVGDIVWGEWPAEITRQGDKERGRQGDRETRREGDKEQGGPSQGRILVLCHLDTVHPAGSLERNPIRRDAGRLYGPGVCDMKASVAATMFVQRYLQQGAIRPGKAVRFLYTTDEEIGSFESRQIIEAFARDSDIALVLEPPLAGGELKLSRKGSGVFRIRVRGRASHAGAAPEKGINAILELSGQICRIQELENRGAGTTVSVTLVHGGTAENVIPESAEATIDVRFLTIEEGARVESALRMLSPTIAGAQIGVEGQLDRPPMEHGPRARELFERARQVASEIGLDLQGGSSGGGSDGSFTAAQGVPTLDGLGVEGGGAHSPDEYILIDSLSTRTALLALLLERL